ncbi:LacI family DNA-binding transcriptional regulator [Jannaschia sp. M317]|uniref:LacI family DNA-binding transcriptional regulator n=1 Tax=Jannaschia sp. M317 TaxID=2867011 RepID=UPI0021A484CE|nr:substrate-binding domain-containing protein [Jannaschia sp. M317]UWQ17492.1 substrate-binding domain-containing protein [Jannaschia sp. M317]
MTRVRVDGKGARVTIAQLAAETGLTKGTVSRALNGYPDIAEATRARVQRAADRLGYRPMAQAQAIRTGRAKALGLVMEVSEHDGHSPFLTDFLAGVTTAAGAQGWTLTVATAPSGEQMRDVLDGLIEDRKADGFILQRTLRKDPRIEYLREKGVPFVLYGRCEDLTGISYYDIRGGAAMRAGVRRLVEMGHRDIALVTSGSEYNYAHLRTQGFLTAMAAEGLTPVDVVWGARDHADGVRATRQLLDRDAPPTAIIYVLDQAALGGYRAVKERGLTVGQDVSIMAYDGIPEAANASPPLTTWKVDTKAAGAALARMLIERIKGEAEPEALRWLADATLVEGGSDGPPARTSAHLRQKMINQEGGNA